jgi:hypothetical protein
VLDAFTRTPERAAIIKHLDDAQAALEEAARLLAADAEVARRSRRVTNLAQHVAAQRSLVAQDWGLADGGGGERAARPPAHKHPLK